MRNRWATWLGTSFLCSVLMLAGCDGSGDDTDREAGERVTAVVESIGGKISASSMRDLLPQASEFQRQLLNDGQLTLAEYESAKLAQVRCLQEAGLRVDGDLKPNGLYAIRFLVISDGPLGPTDSRVSNCKKEYASIVEMVWAEVSVPLIQDVIRESRRLMAECYAESDLRVEDKPYDSTDPDVQERYRMCNDRVQTALHMDGVSYGVDGDGRPQ